MSRCFAKKVLSDVLRVQKKIREDMDTADIWPSITFTCDGNPDTRPSTLQPDVQLINIDKYTKLAKIASDFRRFHEPYNLHEIDAVQAYLSRALAERGSGSVDAMYRKSRESLLLPNSSALIQVAVSKGSIR